MSCFVLNVTQSYLFSKYVNSHCFKNPANVLGIELVYIIHEFKRLYNVHKLRANVNLQEWAKMRINLIIFMQLLRILSRDPLSRGAKSLIDKLNKGNNLKLQENHFHFNVNNPETHFFNILASLLLKGEKNLTNLEWSALIAPVCAINGAIRNDNMLKDTLKKDNESLAISRDLDLLKQRVVNYINKALHFINERNTLDTLGVADAAAAALRLKKSLQVTYYPNLVVAKKSLRNRKWDPDKLVKVTINGKNWYKTA